MQPPAVTPRPSNFMLDRSMFLEMLRYNITLTEEIIQKKKIFVQTIMHSRKLNQKYLSARVRQYPNLLSSDPLAGFVFTFIFCMTGFTC